jgi:predicted lipoprotein with Yx(FWY)xxD motif
VFLVVALCLAACGQTTYHPPSTAPTGGLPDYEVKVGSVPGLGSVLVDGQGYTLYMFVPDHQSTSTCMGDCASGWPPVTLPVGVSAPIAGPGIRASLLGTSRRTDGTLQVTYNRWPLYLWVNDTITGEATGQGLDNLGGLWYVLGPAGNVIRSQ